MIKRGQVRSFGQLDRNRVFHAFGVVILRQLCAQSSGLDPDHRVQLRVEVGGAAENLGRDLIFLDGGSWMIQGMLGEIAEELAEGLGAVQHLAIRHSVYLREVLLVFRHFGGLRLHRECNNARIPLQAWGLTRVTVSDALKLASGLAEGLVVTIALFWSRCFGVAARWGFREMVCAEATTRTGPMVVCECEPSGVVWAGWGCFGDVGVAASCVFYSTDT